MGAFISRRVGTDPYYASYEKAFERLEKESSKILVRLPPSSPRRGSANFNCMVAWIRFMPESCNLQLAYPPPHTHRIGA